MKIKGLNQQIVRNHQTDKLIRVAQECARTGKSNGVGNSSIYKRTTEGKLKDNFGSNF